MTRKRPKKLGRHQRGLVLRPAIAPDAPRLLAAAHELAWEARDLPTVTERLRYVLAAASDELVEIANGTQGDQLVLDSATLVLVIAIEAGPECLHASDDELHGLRVGLRGWIAMEGLQRRGLLRFTVPDGSSTAHVDTWSEGFPPDARERVAGLPPLLAKMYAWVLDQPSRPIETDRPQ